MPRESLQRTGGLKRVLANAGRGFSEGGEGLLKILGHVVLAAIILNLTYYFLGGGIGGPHPEWGLQELIQFGSLGGALGLGYWGYGNALGNTFPEIGNGAGRVWTRIWYGRLTTTQEIERDKVSKKKVN